MKPSPWRKSSRSSGGNANCVETRVDSTICQVRDSKLGESSAIMSIEKGDWQNFLTLVRK